MDFDENSVLCSMNPLLTIGGFAAVLALSWFSAWAYRNTNDFKKSSILSMVLMTILAVILLWCQMPLVLVAGFYLCTFVFTSWFSNYYFYH